MTWKEVKHSPDFFKGVSFHVLFHVKFGNMRCCDFSINNPQNSCLVTWLLTRNITFWVKYSIKKSGDTLVSLKKITWLISQKVKGHVEDPCRVENENLNCSLTTLSGQLYVHFSKNWCSYGHFEVLKGSKQKFELNLLAQNCNLLVNLTFWKTEYLIAQLRTRIWWKLIRLKTCLWMKVWWFTPPLRYGCRVFKWRVQN